jgi:uncharacterized membrane protein YeaQ/YmgE (transglycosylase-associated protein family)
MNQPVTVTFVPEQVITWVVIGLIAGFLASIFVRGRGMGLLGNVIVGLLGALIGGFLFSVFNVQVSPALAGTINIRLIDIIVAFIGALIVLLLITPIYYRRRVL